MSSTPAASRLLRSLRETSGQSLRRAASELGVAPSHLSRIERGEKSASPELARRVAGYYGIQQDLVDLADGHVPADILAILQRHPDVLRELRSRYPDDLTPSD